MRKEIVFVEVIGWKGRQLSWILKIHLCRKDCRMREGKGQDCSKPPVTMATRKISTQLSNFVCLPWGLGYLPHDGTNSPSEPPNILSLSIKASQFSISATPFHTSQFLRNRTCLDYTFRATDARRRDYRFRRNGESLHEKGPQCNSQM